MTIEGRNGVAAEGAARPITKIEVFFAGEKRWLFGDDLIFVDDGSKTVKVLDGDALIACFDRNLLQGWASWQTSSEGACAEGSGQSPLQTSPRQRDHVSSASASPSEEL